MERKTIKGILNQIIRLKLYLTVDMREDSKVPYKTILATESRHYVASNPGLDNLKKPVIADVISLP